MKTAAKFLGIGLSFFTASVAASQNFSPPEKIDGTCSPIHHKGEASYCLEESAKDLNALVQDLKRVIEKLGPRNGGRLYRSSYSFTVALSNTAGWYDTKAWCHPNTVNFHGLGPDLDRNEYFLDYRIEPQLQCANKVLMTTHILADKLPKDEKISDLYQRAKDLFDGLIQIRENLIRKGYMQEDDLILKLAADRKEFMNDRDYKNIREEYIGKVHGQATLVNRPK